MPFDEYLEIGRVCDDHLPAGLQGIGVEMFDIQLQGVMVVFFGAEDGFAVVAAIVDMIEGIVLERGWFGHGCCQARP